MLSATCNVKQLVIHRRTVEEAEYKAGRVVVTEQWLWLSILARLVARQTRHAWHAKLQKATVQVPTDGISALANPSSVPMAHLLRI